MKNKIFNFKELQKKTMLLQKYRYLKTNQILDTHDQKLNKKTAHFKPFFLDFNQYFHFISSVYTIIFIYCF